MKNLIIFLLAVVVSLTVGAQEKPDWVKQHPVNSLNFTGIGMCRKSDKDYVQRAKQHALSELASEIKVEVSVNSLLNTIEDNEEVKQTFAESIRTKATAEIERFRLVDTWQDETEYWVYYELNRFDYEEYMEARRQKAIQQGFDFWYKGKAALQQGELMSAVELFSKGLESIEPALNQDLTCSYEGTTINLGTEIYAALTSVFDGITITVNPVAVNGTPFQGIAIPVTVTIDRNGTPLRNILLEARFVSGSGDLSTLAPTNEKGETALSIRNITSKQVQQEIKITIADQALKGLRMGAQAALFKKMLATLPGTNLTVNLEQKQISAYIKVMQADIESLERDVKSILTNNFFNVVATPSQADVIVNLDNKFKTGREIPGEQYNFVECFSTLGIKVVNNRSSAVLMNYSLNDIRTLVPANKSVAQGKVMAARELMKRMQRDLGKELKKVTIDTAGDIPPAPQKKPAQEAPRRPVVVSPVVPVVVPPVVVAPRPKPAPVAQPVPAPKSEAIRGELDTNVFIEYTETTSLGDKSRLHFKVINKTNDDFEMHVYISKVLVINDKGEEVKVKNVKVGSVSGEWDVKTFIVPDVPTEMVVEVTKLNSTALFSLKDVKQRTIKLRNLK